MSHTATFQAPELEEVAALFPSYDIHGLIACGGMGAVYHANQRSLERDVAIKILPREFSQDQEFRVSFEAEAKAMAKLNHPNLIGVYDFGDVAGLLYIVMEYVPGSSLYSLSHGRVVEQGDALKIVIDICHGLAHAHDYGILHRDIKPSNILLDVSGSPKIGDFGLASKMGNQIQEGEQIFGTPGYTAPEVIEPPHTFDQRADIFSVGVMLYELLTGVTPDGQKPISSMPKIPNPKLQAIIQRATHNDPNARHTSAEELAKDLEKIAAMPHNPLLAAAASKGRPAGGALGRRHMPVRKVSSSSSSGTGFLILLLLIAAGAVYYFVFMQSGDPEPVEAPRIQNRPAPNATNNTSTIPVPPKPVRRKTAAEQGVKPIDDVDAFFVRVEGIMKDRIKDDLETYHQSLKANTTEFETQAKKALSSLDAGTASAVSPKLDAALQAWKGDNYKMGEVLPDALSKISAIQELYSIYYSNQLKSRSRIYQKLISEQATYTRGLKSQIDRYRQQKDPVAVSLLEKEVARLNSEPGYYEFIVSN
jgi:serine/threonine protein kinase